MKRLRRFRDPVLAPRPAVAYGGFTPLVGVTLGLGFTGIAVYLAFATSDEDWVPVETESPYTVLGGFGMARDAFVAWAKARAEEGAKVRWAAKGDYYVDSGGNRVSLSTPAYDCSGLITSGILAATGKDIRDTHNAQRLFDEAAAVGALQPGDLGFYRSGSRIIHVVIYLGSGRLISADGASDSLTARLLGGHTWNAGVKVHTSENYRSGFAGWRKNIWV